MRPQQITIASKMVKDFTGVMLQPHKVCTSSCVGLLTKLYQGKQSSIVTQHFPAS